MYKQFSLGFTDHLAKHRRLKTGLLDSVDKIVDWRRISNLINKHYNKGQRPQGQHAYSGLMLFKMSLLQTWHGLSDYELEHAVNDRISFSRFCGIPIEEKSPDHSTVSRFRTACTEKGLYDKLLKELNRQLVNHNVIVKQGVMVDASIIDTPLKPKGKSAYVGHNSTDGLPKNSDPVTGNAVKPVAVSDPTDKTVLEKDIASSVDREAGWIKKSKFSKPRYGFKKHHVTDDAGLVLGVVTTAANVNEISNLEAVLDSAELPKKIPVKADKGYQSEKNAKILSGRRLKNQIMKKAKKGKPLSERERAFNRGVSKTRYKVERTFGSIKRWFHTENRARYRGLAKMHTQNLLEAMAYNLYRAPRIIVQNGV